MDVADRRLPQDGRHTLKRGPDIFDLRISCLPAQFEDEIAIRLLSKSVKLLNLDNLKLPAAVRKLYQEMIDNPQGFYLSPGPPEATLYATLNNIDRDSVNVITLEDPIEYSLEKITRVGIHERPRPRFRSRPALDLAPGSRRHPGRENARPRNSRHCLPRRAHRT